MNTESLNIKEVFRIGLGDPEKQEGVPDRTQRALKTRRHSGSDSESLGSKVVIRIGPGPGEP